MELPRLPAGRADHGCGSVAHGGNVTLVVFGGQTSISSAAPVTTILFLGISTFYLSYCFLLIKGNHNFLGHFV